MSKTHIVNGILSQRKDNNDCSEESALSTSVGKKTTPVKSSFNEEYSTYSLVDPIWETLDPTPDVHALFLLYNDMFFKGALGGCEVKWSPRMTSCAGICSYEGRGGLCSIRLSKPLLILRPRRDLVETLLHEMIHAYLFVTVRDRDRDGHGVRFQYHMRRINEMAGTHITIYHRFFAEVANYKRHWWRCDGPCRTRRPYFGWVKRASNRAPGPNDFWWKQHQQCCGGKFIKVKEPEEYAKNKRAKDIKAVSKKIHKTTEKGPPSRNARDIITGSFSGKGYVLGSGALKSKGSSMKSRSDGSQALDRFLQNREVVQASNGLHNKTSVKSGDQNDDVTIIGQRISQNETVIGPQSVNCPSCNLPVLTSAINMHLDQCLTAT